MPAQVRQALLAAEEATDLVTCWISGFRCLASTHPSPLSRRPGEEEVAVVAVVPAQNSAHLVRRC